MDTEHICASGEGSDDAAGDSSLWPIADFEERAPEALVARRPGADAAEEFMHEVAGRSSLGNWVELDSCCRATIHSQ